ncbi:MAG: serpin family protein [Bacteroidales bacterium]|jgi:serpin B
MKFQLILLLICILTFRLLAENPTAIAEGNNKFAFKLYNELKNKSDKNIIYSPFSISTALAMVYAGARNETADQIRQVMNFQPGEQFNLEYKNFLKTLSDSSQNHIKLNIANGLWVQENFNFYDSYLGLVTTNYDSELKRVDFINKDARERATVDINTWIEHKTNGKIRDILDRNSLDSFTRMVLVNAIYFYGDWAQPFQQEFTHPQDFFLSEQSHVNVPFVNRIARYNYYEDSTIKAIEIPYKDNKASMLIFLPNDRNGIAGFDMLFDYKYYVKVIDNLQSNEVSLAFPKFTTTYHKELEDILPNMGMPLAFSPLNADFSGMCDIREHLYIKKVIHQAFIKVTEEGTEAAAATVVIMKAGSARIINIKHFIADHPFIFLIKDNTTGSILFFGKLMNPKQE